MSSDASNQNYNKERLCPSINNLKETKIFGVNHLLSNSASWQCGSNQSLGEDLFAIPAFAFPPPTSSLKLSNLFSLPDPLFFLSASFSFCLNRCFRFDKFTSSFCFDCEGGAPCGPRQMFSSFFTYTNKKIQYIQTMSAQPVSIFKANILAGHPNTKQFFQPTFAAEFDGSMLATFSLL